MSPDDEVNSEAVKYPEITLDLNKISEKSEFSFKKMLEIHESALPMSTFAQKLAQGDGPYAHAASVILQNASKLIEMNEISAPVVMDGIGLRDYERENIATALKNLNSLGLELDEKRLIASSEDDEEFRKAREEYFQNPLKAGLMEIAEGVQREYAMTVYSTRAYEVARLIAKEHAPNLPWYEEKAMYSFVRRATSREYNGMHNVFIGNIHLLHVQDFWGLDMENRLAELKSPQAKVEEYFGDKTVVAFHESGHAVFTEFYGIDELMKIKLPEGRKEANIWKALTEGTAIEYEQVGDAALQKMVPMLPPNFNYGPMAISDRQRYFEETGQDILAREYHDGHLLMQKLKTQLGITELSQQDQLVELAKFLKKVDVVEASKISFSDPRYMKMIEDPMVNLPLKKED